MGKRYVKQNDKLFAERLDDLVNEKAASGTTAAKIAAKLGISASTFSEYRSGEKMPPLAFAVRMADYFDVSMDYFIGRDVPRSPKKSIRSTAATLGLEEKTIKKLITLLIPIGPAEAKKHSFTPPQYLYGPVLNALIQSNSFDEMIVALKGATTARPNDGIKFDNYTAAVKYHQIDDEIDKYDLSSADIFSVRDVYNANYDRAAKNAFADVVAELDATWEPLPRPEGFTITPEGIEPLQPPAKQRAKTRRPAGDMEGKDGNSKG